jgi:hypothetical protein
MKTECATKIIITTEYEVLPEEILALEMYLNDVVATKVYGTFNLGVRFHISQPETNKPIVDDGWEPDIPGPDPRRFMPKSSHL